MTETPSANTASIAASRIDESIPNNDLVGGALKGAATTATGLVDAGLAAVVDAAPDEWVGRAVCGAAGS